MSEKADTNRTSPLILGGILILIGVVFLAQNLTDFDLGNWNWWALFILIPAVGSLANALRITISTASGRSGRVVRGIGKGSLTCLKITAMGVSALKGTCPVTISYKITPSE